MPAWTHFRLPSGRLVVLVSEQGGETSKDSQKPRVEAPPPSKDAGQSTTPETQTPARKQPAMGDQCMQMLPMFALFIGLMYFLMIRPQQKQEKARRAMLEAVKKGDQIVTSGGIHGQVASLDEKTVTIKFGSGDGQRIKLDRTAISRVVPKGGEQAES